MAVYYISATGLTGNNGTSFTTSWPLSKVGSFAFSAGDNVLFNKGDIFSGTTTFSHSGSVGNPITFDLYGNSINNAILDAAGSASSVLKLNSANYITINNLVFQNSTNSFALLDIENSHDVTVNNCYFNNGVRGMYIFSSTGNINITNNYFTNISDPNINTNGGGSRIQVSTCVLSVGNISITGNKTYEPTRNNGIGDQFSLFKCSGTSSFSFIMDSNEILGGSSNPAGFAAFTFGDNGGSYQFCTNNIVINPGKSAMACGGVTNGTISGNRIYSDRFPTPAAPSSGIIIGNYIGATNTNITCSNNKLNWTQFDGSIDNIFLDTGSGYVATPTGYATNTPPGVADTGATSTMLPNPLWTGSPWNTLATPIISYSPSANIYTTGVLISALNPTNMGGAATGYTISPSLPAGLNFNLTTGIITGTPTISNSLTSYTITAYNSLGTGTATINITVIVSSLFIVFSGRRIAFR